MKNVNTAWTLERRPVQRSVNFNCTLFESIRHLFISTGCPIFDKVELKMRHRVRLLAYVKQVKRGLAVRGRWPIQDITSGEGGMQDERNRPCIRGLTLKCARRGCRTLASGQRRPYWLSDKPGNANQANRALKQAT